MPTPGAIPTGATPEPMIWMHTAGGRGCRTTAMFGFRTSRMAGFLIGMATGFGSLPTVGHGSDTSLGAGRLITTDAGSPMAHPGRGGRDRCGLAITRCGRQHTYPSGAGAGALGLTSASADGAASAGSRSDRVTGSTRGGADTGDALAS